MCSGSGENGPKPKTKSSGLGYWLAYEFDYTINQIISPIQRQYTASFTTKWKDNNEALCQLPETNIRMTFYD